MLHCGIRRCVRIAELGLGDADFGLGVEVGARWLGFVVGVGVRGLVFGFR